MSEDQKTKKKVFTAESAKERFLLTNSGVMISILGVSSLELHSSGTEPVTFFGAQSSLKGAQFSLREGDEVRVARADEVRGQ